MKLIHFGLTKQFFENNRMGSLKSNLILLFLAISIIPLVVVVSVAFVQSQNALRAQASQQLVAVRNLKVKQVETYLHQIEQDVQLVADLEIVASAAQQLDLGVRGQGLASVRALGYLGHPELLSLEIYNPYAIYHRQYHAFFSQLAQNKGYADVWLVTPEGDIIYSSAKRDDFATNLLEGPYRDTAPARLFQNLISQNEAGQVQMIDYAPYAPAGDIPVGFAGALLVSEDQTVGLLIYELSLEQISDFMQDYTGLGETGETYLVGAEDKRLRSQPRFGQAGNFFEQTVDTIAVQKGVLGETGIDTLKNYRGLTVLSAYQPLEVGGLKWVLLAEVENSEAFGPANRLRDLMGGIILVTMLVVVGLGLYTGRSIANPIVELAQTASRIAAGDLKLTAKAGYKNEIGHLAHAFNSMTAQLRQTLAGLEERVADRTQRLEIAANISERLNAILNLEELLFEVVNQVKDNFDYYHAHIYLLDENQEYLVMTAGTGPAGAKMKEQGHRIRLDAPTSLVARVARNKEIVRIDNVREAPDWLPNELLPDTYSEIAVPIVLEGKVVGVLDVQEDKIAGLDEGDSGLLRSLANQVAVAIRNARQFEQVETALAEAHELQQRYLQQAWDRTQVARRGAGRVQYNLDEVVTLPEATIAEARQQALARQQLAVVAINGDDGHTRPALVAPITLQNVPIGDLQLHGLDPDREFTEGELALISAVVDQVTQVAEGLRLLDETQERASRERLIGRVSDKLRRAPDMDTLMQLAVDELARVLGPARTFVRLGSEAEFGVGPDVELDNGGNGTDLPEDSLAEKTHDPSLRPTNGSGGESELNGNA
jgi:GAF domain-containing protein/HAMP domain-containing protein